MVLLPTLGKPTIPTSSAIELHLSQVITLDRCLLEVGISVQVIFRKVHPLEFIGLGGCA